MRHLWTRLQWCAGRHGVYMLPNYTCPDVFDDNGPNVLSQIKVGDRHKHNVAHAALPAQAQIRLQLTFCSALKCMGS